MAELQVTLPYKTLPQRAAFATMCALFPLWAVVAPAALGFFIGSVMSNPANLPAWATATTCLSLLSFTLVSVGITAVAEDNRIHISKDGIAFPLFMLPRLQFRRQRSWSELRLADVVETTNGEAPYAVLSFNNGNVLSLRLHCLKQQDAEQLFLGVELWANSCERTPRLIDYQRAVQNEGRELGQTGYTQMWEEELSRRFSATAFMPLEPGHKLAGGKITIVRQIAFGGLSAIYLAQENEKDLIVIKEAVVPANADVQARAQAEQHLVREAQVLSALRHDRIARVLDHFVDEGRHYLKLEYINGQDLRQFVKQNGAPDQSTCLRWGKQIASILAFLHSQSPPIIHRDLTPDNLVLTKSGDVMLIDFGAANVFVGSATGTIVGKQAYIPAEQLRGKAVLASDVYALGGTLYFLLTGQDPLALSVSKPSTCSQASAAVDAIVARCTQFEPEQRYQSAQEVEAALDALLAQPEAEVAAT